VQKTETGTARDMHGKYGKAYRISVEKPEAPICRWENATTITTKETALEAVNWIDVFEHSCEYERSSEFLVSIKCEEFPDYLQNYYFLKKVSSPWS
jgi:hypothetical protein